MPTRLSLNSLDSDYSDFLSNLKGGKKKSKSSKKTSKLVSKKPSKKPSKVSRKKSKASKKPSKVSKKTSKVSRKKSKTSKKPSKLVSKKPSKVSKKPSKMSKNSKRKVKRELPLKLQAFQKIVKYLATELGGHSPMIFKLAKIIRNNVIEKNPNASVDDITKKTIEEFNKNKSKYTTEYQKLKKN